MPANYTCNLDTLIQNSMCFNDACCSRTEREAIDLFFRVQNLKASGGKDYTAAGGFAVLVSDASLWGKLGNSDQIESIALWMDEQNAIFNGAVFNQNINVIKADHITKRATNIGELTRKQLLVYLKCQLNSIDQPD